MARRGRPREAGEDWRFVAVRLPPEVLQEVDRRAGVEGVSRARWLRRAVAVQAFEGMPGGVSGAPGR